MVAPVPIGVTASFSNVPAGSIATSTFTFSDSGIAVVTFQPVSLDTPGVVTLYDSSNNVVTTLNSEGYETVIVPNGGASYYFKATLGANILAMTMPSIWS